LINRFNQLAPSVQAGEIKSKNRFEKEFGPEEDDPGYKRFKPVDWNELFRGNIDDCFRIGISLAQRSVRLYAEFYRSEIIIASPLGLRINIGGPTYVLFGSN
jgi:U3 small nucleolar RNA-associated protein 25